MSLFGGVGGSGHGKYHGKYGFLEFSHQRPVVGSPTWLNKFMGLRFCPIALRIWAKLK
jgi:hypothetical protein